MIVGLDEMKAHLRIDHDDEDATVSAVSLAAEAQVRNWIGRQIYARSTDMPGPERPGYDPHQMVADEAIGVAIKQLGELMYTDRGGSGGSEDDAVPPRSIRALLSGYRVFWGQEDGDANRPTD